MSKDVSTVLSQMDGLEQ